MRDNMKFEALTAVTTRSIYCLLDVKSSSLTDLHRLIRGNCRLKLQGFLYPEDGSSSSSETAVNRVQIVTFRRSILFTDKNMTCDCIYFKSLDNVDDIAPRLLLARFGV
jgi:hypothetical protein